MVMQFCKLHSLELSTSYLRECAKANEWLQFLIQTQLHGHQPAQVSSLGTNLGLGARGCPSVDSRSLTSAGVWFSWDAHTLGLW